MEEFFNFINYILENHSIVWCVMAVIIFAITQLIKLPIKHFTNKIKNERKRKIANATILLIPFGLGILLDFLYTKYLDPAHTSFNIITGLGYGTAGISLYGIIERFFKVKLSNPYDTEEGKSVTELVDEVTADGKIDSSDNAAVQDFLDKYSK